MTTTSEPRANRWYLQYDNVTKVLDRVIITRHQITGGDVLRAPKLRETGEYVIDNYTGQNEFMLSLQLRMWNGATLSPYQLAAAWRALHSEYTANLKVIKPAENRPQLPNGRYTVINDTTAEYRTIELSDCPERYSKPAGTQIAAFLSDPNNEADYIGFAFVFPGRKSVLFNRYRSNLDLCYSLAVLLDSDGPAYGELYAIESGRCYHCNRVLTVPVSVHNGLGPTCAKKLGITRKEMPKRTAEQRTSKTREQAQAEIDELFPE
jgi:hypothetical protein